jgi:putative ABC transport system substrate-binding protein
VAIEPRWAEGSADRYPALAAELVRLKVDVIVLSGSLALRAARQATDTIPIVLGALLIDPVSAGFVASLARPGGTVTGLASQYEEIVTKQVQLLAEAVPGLSRIALIRLAGPGSVVQDAALAAAGKLGLHARVLEVSDVMRFEEAFRTASRERAQAVLVLPSPIFNVHRRVLIAAAASHRLPAFYELREYVLDGGLMSYGPSVPDMFRRAASYVDRILKGAKPGDLPIEHPNKFDLAINLRTARALGLTLPQTLLQQADEVIP